MDENLKNVYRNKDAETYNNLNNEYSIERRLEEMRLKLEEAEMVKKNEVIINKEKQALIDALEMQILTLAEINDRYAKKIVQLKFLIKKFLNLDDIPFGLSFEERQELADKPSRKFENEKKD